MAGHAQLKFVMAECSKTQIRLAGIKCAVRHIVKIKQDYNGNSMQLRSRITKNTSGLIFISIGLFYFFLFYLTSFTYYGMVQ